MFGKSVSQVAIGDQFVESNRERSGWSVEFVFGDPNGVPHARLRKLGDPTVARTFAVAVLMADPRFRRVATADAAATRTAQTGADPVPGRTGEEE